MGNRNAQKCLFAMPSATYAIRASELIAKFNIPSRVIQIDPNVTKKGCSNGIEVDCRLKDRVKSILLDNNIPISRMIGG